MTTGANLTIASDAVTDVMSNGTFVFNVRKLQKYVNIDFDVESTGTDDYCVILVATTLGEAPAAYSDSTVGSY